MQHYDLIVFDWDGTLMDSTALIASCLRAACADLALPVPSEAEAKYIIGLGMADSMRRLLPDLPPADYPRLGARYRDHFLARENEAPLFPGVDALLAGLAAEGYLLGVATGKSRRGLDHALAATATGRWFHATRCADESFSKPHPAMLEALMAELAAAPARTLMVGDTTHDLQMAANAGCHGVAVAAGAHGREELLTLAPLACLESVTDLARWLKTPR